MTTPELFATALGKPLNPGLHQCFWCGASCDSSRKVSVSDTFWDWDAVAFPRSKWQCVGCCECLDEKRSLPGKDKPQKTRNYSWLITESQARPMTKADIADMRSVLLSPPSGRWAMAIAESGQKHVIYRAPVNDGGPTWCVQLELQAVEYRCDELSDAIERCAKIASVCGKPSLAGPLNVGAVLQLGNGELVSWWNRVWASPLIRLAAFLCPSKEQSVEYLAGVDGGRVPQAVGGTGGRSRNGRLFD